MIMQFLKKLSRSEEQYYYTDTKIDLPFFLTLDFFDHFHYFCNIYIQTQKILRVYFTSDKDVYKLLWLKATEVLNGSKILSVSIQLYLLKRK